MPFGRREREEEEPTRWEEFAVGIYLGMRQVQKSILKQTYEKDQKI
jgi:hypothetical protein